MGYQELLLQAVVVPFFGHNFRNWFLLTSRHLRSDHFSFTSRKTESKYTLEQTSFGFFWRQSDRRKANITGI